jgi:hypothetical protein
MKHEKEFGTLIAAAVRQAKTELRDQQGIEDLFGFALCTDDDVRTLYHVACTPQWVREKESGYPGIGFIYVEWEHSADDTLFAGLSAKAASLADQKYPSSAEWATERDRRFETLVLALQECRDGRVFAEDTFLCVGSTDPSDHLEALAMNAVDRLNSPKVADQFADLLGYAKHRRNA